MCGFASSSFPPWFYSIPQLCECETPLRRCIVFYEYMKCCCCVVFRIMFYALTLYASFLLAIAFVLDAISHICTAGWMSENVCVCVRWLVNTSNSHSYVNEYEYLSLWLHSFGYFFSVFFCVFGLFLFRASVAVEKVALWICSTFWQSLCCHFVFLTTLSGVKTIDKSCNILRIHNPCKKVENVWEFMGFCPGYQLINIGLIFFVQLFNAVLIEFH